jgi:hypothetical protein
MQWHFMEQVMPVINQGFLYARFFVKSRKNSPAGVVSLSN